MTLLAATDWYAFFFLLFAGLACVFAAAVLFTANIVRMAFFLTLSLGATAGLFFLAGAQFVGAMQLMIYVGGTLVLLIFGVMLTAQARFISMRTLSGEWVLAIVVGSAFLMLLLTAAFSVDDWRTGRPAEPLSLAEAQTATALGAGLSGVRVDKLNVTDPVTRGGMSGYVLPFVIVSVHLLVVLVGAAFMARTKLIGQARPVTVSAGDEKRRSPLVTAWMGILLAGDLVAMGTLLFATPWLRSLISDLAAAPDWLFVAAWFLALFHAVCVLALFSWQRWGFYGLCVVAALAFLTVAAGVGLLWGIVKLVSLAATIGILYGLLQLGGADSAWNKLES